MSASRNEGEERAIYIISVAAELAGVHPQTLRVYERKGLVQPSRTQGNTRRYSQRDIDRLRRITELTNEGINLAGVLKVIELEDENERLRSVIEGREHMALVPLRDVRRIRRALKSDRIDQASKRRTFQVPPASS
jgi:MerR family transcriptional regulator, heat shock protein HspR